ncbi:MAG: hypothetical protein A2Y71_00320 [Bacteroidetes bacterium RBG_13_42_15]|nr:MAG: hypothetical protein A2Y71_00320 [Bacteroidetes bacterium RBG_13_42_15]
MKPVRLLIILVLIVLAGNCITPFTPETEEEKVMLVVKGMITDQYGINTIKLTTSVPLNKKNIQRPYKGCTVTISDDQGNIYLLAENQPGEYITNPGWFQGIAGRRYKLRIENNKPGDQNRIYESSFIEMVQVPQIDSVYYKKVDINTHFGIVNACQIYVDTHDPLDECRNYRWEFSETWEFHLPEEYNMVEHRICWVTENSEIINVKNTSLLKQNRIAGYPLCYIPPKSDRFQVKYSILVTQYSINEQEYDYWSKVKNIAEEVGNLYDVTPASITGNIHCTNDATETVLGYFSVSSVCSKRLFIKDTFEGLTDRYLYCTEGDTTVFRSLERVSGLGSRWWVIIEGHTMFTPFWVLTRFHDCADCRVRGTDIEPPFWHDDE